MTNPNRIGRLLLIAAKNILRSSPGGMAFVFLLMLISAINSQGQEFMPGKKAPFKYQVDRRVDNMGYWKRMAELGLVPVAPARAVPSAIFKSSIISDASVATYDSPDVPVTSINSTQSENSVFIHPSDRFTILNSNNSSINPYPGYFFGADDFFSVDGGESWDGQVHGVGGYNMGDPSTAINSNGRWFVGYIHSGGGQALSYSNDGGATWKVRAIASPPSLDGGTLDKSHLWIDNSPASPYKGNLYDGWTVFTGPLDGKIQISRSTDNGLAWQMPVTISDSIHAGSYNQGVNIATGPNGEVYSAWSVYDGYPGDEKAIGFARSFNGGQTWQYAHRIINNIRGIRISGVNKRMRVNSFPSMAVDNSNSPWRGTIYLVWANINQPGINSGTGVDVYLIHSADSGSTWSQPIRVNQDLPSPGKKHYFPWITCDPANGNLAVVFYDDRDVPEEQAETWVATSTDGGNNWQDFRVSDVSFTPSPVTGLSDDYFGDYLGIQASNGQVYPCWTDNRTGVANTWVSPFRLGPAPGQAYIAFQSFVYNDSIGGNGNGNPDYGESPLLSLSLRNMGDQPDTSVNVTLSSNSPYVQFIDSTGFIESIAAGQTFSLQDEFAFHISEVIPNETRLFFTVTAVDHFDSTFKSSFSFKVTAPELLITDFIVNDSTGNNSHSLDPSETAFVKIRLRNPTPFTASNTRCYLESPQPFIHLADSVVTIGDVPPGESRDAVFGIMVDSVRAGTLASFNSKAEYSGLQTERSFKKKIGLMFEDWESSDFRKFSWQLGGDKDWKIDSTYQYEGKYCARSGLIGHSKESFLTVKCRALTYDSISFFRKVSSEDRYDFLNFYIDNAKVGQWAGEMDWERVVFPLVPGLHELKWEYNKDKAVENGLDAAFVDYIEFPSIQYTTSDAGPDASINECQNFACLGAASYYDSLRWTTTGSGIFLDPQKAHTQYTPSQADKAAGLVTLILTVFGPSVDEIAVDSMNLVIVPRPTAYAGPDAGICAGEAFHVALASAANYQSLSWSTLGQGVFNDRTSVLPVYSPGAADSIAGKVHLVLSTYSNNTEGCGMAKDTLELTIYSLPVIPLEEKYERCGGYSATLDATTPGGTSYQWQPGGGSSPEITVDTTGIGIGHVVYGVTVVGDHGCISTKLSTIEFINCEEKYQAGNVFFRVYPNPVRDDLYIELFSKSKQEVSYQLSNDAGSIIIQSDEFELEGLVLEHLNLLTLAQGTYLFTVKSGDQSATKKIIVI